MRENHRLWAALAWCLPILLLAAFIRSEVVRSVESQRAPAGESPNEARVALARECAFPAERRGRLVIAMVDSLRWETALDSRVMPFLVAHRAASAHGRMTPCLSQLSLLCARTIFEGSEPLLVSGVTNFSGGRVEESSLLQRLATRGVRIAAVADPAFISLYEPWLALKASFADRPPDVKTRDEYAAKKTFEFLDDATIGVIFSLTIDTDAVAHRHGVGHAEYETKFREADAFLRALHARLGATDHLFIVGDHGHDDLGNHSTGVTAPTAFFASGPVFQPGARVELEMASSYFLLGAATCDAVPAGYRGALPYDALRLEPAEQAAFSAANVTSPAEVAAGKRVPLREGAALFLLVAIGLTALVGHRARKREIAAAGAALFIGIIVPHVAWLWAAGIGMLASAARAVRERPRIALFCAATVITQAAHGLVASTTMVALQNNVNPRWTIGFLLALALLALAVATVLRRTLQARYAIAAPLTAWGVTFFGLFLGPYYYASARNVLFATTWLLVALAWGRLARSSTLRRSVGVAALSLVPVHFPIMKEWQVGYFMLEASRAWPSGVVLLAALALVGFAAVIAPERRAFAVRACGATLAVMAIGIPMGLASPTLLAATLVVISYVATWGALGELGLGGGGASSAEGGSDGAGAISDWVSPIMQATYAYAIFFVVFGGLRIANVDFRFVFSLVTIEEGEARAAVIATPLLFLKYLGPVLAVLATGPLPDGRALGLLTLKGAGMLSAYIGFEIAGARATVLFHLLQGQEILIFFFLYVAVLLAVGARAYFQQRSREVHGPRPFVQSRP